MINNNLYGAMGFYLVPIFIGLGILTVINLLSKTQKEAEEPYGWLFAIFESFTLGTLLIFTFKIFINLPQDLFIQLVFFLMGLSILAFLTTITIKRRWNQKFNPTSLIVVLLAIVLSLGIYALWRFDSPKNATLNWDIYHHQTLATLINRNQFHFNTTRISDTFQFSGYSTIFHTILAFSQFIFATDILEFWWNIEFFHLLSTVLASFLVGYTISRRTKVGIISAIFGSLVFESSGAYTSLFLIPQNLTALLGAVYWSKVIRNYESGNKLIDVSTFAFMFVALFMHVVIGLMAVGAIFGTALYLSLRKTYKENVIDNIFITLALIGMASIPLLAALVDLSSLNQGEAAYYNPSLPEKFNLMKMFYAYSFLAFLPLGLYNIAKEKTAKNYALITLIVILLVSVLSPIPYAPKLYAFVRFFVHAAMAMGVWLLIKRFNNFVFSAALALLIIIVGINLVINFVIFKQVPTYKEVSTHVSPNELEAVRFLEDNYSGKNVLLISEPATMHILEGLSGINSAGGAYASQSTRSTISKTYFARDSERIVQELSSIKDSVLLQQPEAYLLAISGRYEKWQKADEDKKMNFYFNIWTPYDLSPEALSPNDFIDFMRRVDGVREVFRNNGIVIFEFSQTSPQNY